MSSHNSKQSLSSQHGALSLSDWQTAEDESDNFDSNSEYSSFFFSQDTFYESSQGSTTQLRSSAFPDKIQDVCLTGENLQNNDELILEINTRGDKSDDGNDDDETDDNTDNGAKNIDNLGGWKTVGRSLKFQKGSKGTVIEYYHAGAR